MSRLPDRPGVHKTAAHLLLSFAGARVRSKASCFRCWANTETTKPCRQMRFATVWLRALLRRPLPRKALCASMPRISSIGMLLLSRASFGVRAPDARTHAVSLSYRKSAFFDNRQPGEKIQFDSQSIGGEDEQPVAGPSGADRRRRRRSASSEQRSPEQFRGREERLASPLPSRRVLENEDDDDDDAPRPAPAAVPLHDTQAFEADHYADEFGGGFDEAGGSDRSEIAVAHHANRARDGGASKARQRAAPGAKRRGTSAAKQPSAQVKRAAAFAGSLAAGAPASSRKATAARRSDSPTSDFDSLSSSDGDTSVDSRRQIRRPSTQKHREAPNRKRQRVDRFVLSSDDEPVERDRSQSKRQRRIDPPRAAGSGNIYFQDRNQPGARIDWTPEETRLLHQYLREYGCDWKRMMERSGPHGTEDQTFRNRTNVSLKDKAVNEKLWLLKHGHKVPGYFAGGECCFLRRYGSFDDC